SARHRDRVAWLQRHRADRGVGRTSRNRYRPGDLPRHIRRLGRQVVRLRDHVLGMAGAPVRETENLVTDGEPLDPGADLRHDAGEVTPLSGWECGWPDRVKHSLPDLGLTGIDRRGLDFHQYFSVSRLR